MRISKHVHSCLVVEEGEKVAVVDPGSYTAAANALNVAALHHMDYVLITHEHADHMDVGLIKQLLREFPHAKVISNGSVKKLLGKESITVMTEGNDDVALEAVPHEMTLDGAPENVMFTLFGRLAHPGDSHHFSTAAEILAMPIQAPWGSFVSAMEKTAHLQPKAVIPIHDWHWNDEARKALYKRAERYLAEKGIAFKAMETGQTVEL